MAPSGASIRTGLQTMAHSPTVMSAGQAEWFPVLLGRTQHGPSSASLELTGYLVVTLSLSPCDHLVTGDFPFSVPPAGTPSRLLLCD